MPGRRIAFETWTCLTLLALLSGAPALAAEHAGEGEASEPIFTEDFETSPMEKGWTMESYGKGATAGAWVRTTGNDKTAEQANGPTTVQPADGNGHLRGTAGYWHSPSFEVEPLKYYKVTFDAWAEQGSVWAVIFFDEEGEKLNVDIYDSIFASDGDWRRQKAMIRVPVDAVTAKIRVHGGSPAVRVDRIRVAPTTEDAIVAWADNMFLEMPIVRYMPPKRRFDHLPETIETLKNGGTLRIVMLGDSICNDISNSLYETILERKYPDAEIEVIASVRGSTGSTYYQNKDRVQDYVLRHEPDLLMIAGISHSYDAEAIGSVIEQVRAESDAEIMVMTGAVTPRHVSDRGALRWLQSAEARRQRIEKVGLFEQRIRQVCAEKDVAFFDMRRAWDKYIRQATADENHARDWWMRDRIHSNRRGKQVAGRLLVRWFDPALDPGAFPMPDK